LDIADWTTADITSTDFFVDAWAAFWQTSGALSNTGLDDSVSWQCWARCSELCWALSLIALAFEDLATVTILAGLDSLESWCALGDGWWALGWVAFADDH
jgi:hypothetical protein